MTLRHDALDQFLANQVARGRMPAACWWVGRGGHLVSGGALGATSSDDDAREVHQATPFDLASLTKALATAPLLVLLEQERLLDLQAPLSTVLDELRGTAIGSHTLVSLASHTAGLPAWAPLYVRASGIDGTIAAIASMPPAGPPGDTLYSDLGYILLGAVLERAARSDLASLFDERIARPLALERTGFAVGGRDFADAAMTEMDNCYERTLAGAEGAGYRWRERIPAGQVHDANAHALGGVAGHAGLFGTASEVARVAAELLEPGTLPLGQQARSRLTEVVPPSDGRTVGLVVAARSGAARGVLPDEAPGHTGFTGTSLWLDPHDRGCFVLLTNRVHPRVPHDDFQPLRRAFHRLAARRASGE